MAVGGDLSVARLRLAYEYGLFPWTSNPVTWWSPDPRGVFELEHFHTPRSLRRTLNQGRFQVTFDQAFQAVIQACAEPAPNRRETWITPEFVKAYTSLHQAGLAHSVETWMDETLVGGVYGVTIGGLFAGESMFHRAADASKVALAHLAERLRAQGFVLFDIQMVTPVTQRLGAVTIPRADYLRRLTTALRVHARFQPEAL